MDERNYQAVNEENTEVRENIYSALNRTEFKDRMVESFPSVYLTLISIVQGVSVSVLAANFFDLIANPGGTSWLEALPYALLSFFAIVLVSFKYNWFVGIYKWSPKFPDTLIPFLLGIFQIGPLYFFGEPRVWWIINIFFALAGVSAFFNTLSHTRIEMFRAEADKCTEADEAFKTTRRSAWLGIVVSFLSAALFFVMALEYGQTAEFLYWHRWEFAAFVVYLVSIFFLVWQDQTSLRKLHHIFGYKF